MNGKETRKNIKNQQKQEAKKSTGEKKYLKNGKEQKGYETYQNNE